MHRISINEAWILVGIYRAQIAGEGSFAAIISSLPDIGWSIPSHSDFAAAYNKFLYIRFIHAEGDNTSLTDAAKQLVESAKNSLPVDSNEQEWVDGVYQVLSTYKLKSMCARQVWTENQYLAATVNLTKE
ncbi:MAG: hypothetical protein AAGC78_09485 [Cellvibrio sp.]|uniref:hypothetical protein n=1 Tax=Cellvibrio sp. TaxID=1965322 RepID=UPI0031A8618D